MSGLCGYSIDENASTPYDRSRSTRSSSASR